MASAMAQGWKTDHDRRGTWRINGQLSIDWLTENLERRLGLEQYAWASGSSRSHGEHPADTASWMSLSQSLGGVAPAWMMALWSTGLFIGPRLFFTTFAAYTGQATLGQQYLRFEKAFWYLDGKDLQSDM